MTLFCFYFPKEMSLTECAAEKSVLTDSQRQLQTQVDDLQNQFNQRYVDVDHCELLIISEWSVEYIYTCNI